MQEVIHAEELPERIPPHTPLKSMTYQNPDELSTLKNSREAR